jgi:hypothetical protein
MNNQLLTLHSSTISTKPPTATMAPRPPKPNPDSTSPSPLKPKTSQAKIEKSKTAPKIKAEKAPKTKAEKLEKPKVEKAKTEKKPGKDDKGAKEEKVKTVTGDEAVVLILEYLKAQNRPFSATEVSANLHGKVGLSIPCSPTVSNRWISWRLLLLFWMCIWDLADAL